MKIRSLLKTLGIYIILLLVILLINYLLNGIHTKMYKVRGLPYLFINSLFLLKMICIISVLYISGYIIFSTKDLYKYFLKNEIIKEIGKKSKSEATISDLITFFRLNYNDYDIKFNTPKNYISLPFFVFIIIFLYFFIAIVIEMLFMYYDIQNKYSYIVILLFWTFIYTILYLYSRIFFFTSNRNIYIYLIMFILYIIALLIKQNIFDNIFFFYVPYNDDWLNMCAKDDLYERIVTYSKYIIDWSLIQGALIAILTCFNYTNKKYQKYKMIIEANKNEYQSLLKIMDIINEIYYNNQFKILCEDISNNVKNDNFYFYKDKIICYHKQILELYPNIKNSEYKWIFDKYHIKFLLSKNYIDKYLNMPTKETLSVCNSCKSFFFTISKEKICQECKKNIILSQ